MRTHTTLVAARALIGAGAWLAPRRTARLIGVRGHLPARTALFWTATGLGAATLGVLAGREG